MTPRTPRDPFWEAVGVLEQLRVTRPACAECGMRTFHRFDCSQSSSDEQRANARRRMIDRRRKAWKAE